MLNQEYLTNNKEKGLIYIDDPYRFVEEWKACSKSNDYKADKLYSILDPHIQHWVKMLTIPNYPKDINWFCLVKRIEHPKPLEVLKAWTEDNMESLNSILFEMFLKLARASPFILYRRSKHYMFLVANIFIFRFSREIRSWSNRQKRIKFLDYKEDMDIYEDTKDQYILPELLLTLDQYEKYEKYLILLDLAGYDKQQVAKVTKSREPYKYYEEMLNE